MNLFNIVIVTSSVVFGLFILYLSISYVIYKLRNKNIPKKLKIERTEIQPLNNVSFVLPNNVVSKRRELLDEELELRFKKNSNRKRYAVLNNSKNYSNKNIYEY